MPPAFPTPQSALFCWLCVVLSRVDGVFHFLALPPVFLCLYLLFPCLCCPWLLTVMH